MLSPICLWLKSFSLTVIGPAKNGIKPTLIFPTDLSRSLSLIATFSRPLMLKESLLNPKVCNKKLIPLSASTTTEDHSFGKWKFFLYSVASHTLSLTHYSVLLVLRMPFEFTLRQLLAQRPTILPWPLHSWSTTVVVVLVLPHPSKLWYK